MLVEPLLGIARAEKALGNDAAARRALRKAEKLRPDDVQIRVAPRRDLIAAPGIPEGVSGFPLGYSSKDAPVPANLPLKGPRG